MNSAAPNNWHEANQRSLMAALAAVRAALQRHIERTRNNGPSERHTEPSTPPQQEQSDAKSTNSALDSLCAAFGLSSFEREVLLLSAGIELDSSFAAHCAAAQGDARKTYPTFSLALAALPEAHWSALSPCASLRRWRLIELTSNEGLVSSPLR